MGDNSCDLHDNHRNNTTIEALRSQPTTLPGGLFHQEPTQAIGYWLGLVLCYMYVLYSLPSLYPFSLPFFLPPLLSLTHVVVVFLLSFFLSQTVSYPLGFLGEEGRREGGGEGGREERREGGREGKNKGCFHC